MKGVIVHAYRQGNDIILFIRTKEGKRKIKVTGFHPYFYAPSEKGNYKSIFWEKVKKIYASSPDKVPKLREKYFKHFEADIPYVRRFLIDKGIYACVEIPDKSVINVSEITPTECNILPRIGILDIEVKGDKLPSHENPIGEVIAFTFYDSYKDNYVSVVLDKQRKKYVKDKTLYIHVTTENDLFFIFSLLLSRINPDIITGWNIKFDIDYLVARAKELDFPISLDGIEIFDYLEAYRSTFKLKDYRLKVVAISEGIRKREEVIMFNEALEHYENGNIERFIQYNWDDVDIVKQLEDKHRLILGFYWELKTSVGLESLNKALHNSVLIDTIALRIAKQNNYVLPSISEHRKVGYKGAIVLNPPNGVIENVAVYDMSRYYPSIIISFNISPETKNTEGNGVKVSVNGKEIYYSQDRVGLLPQICKKFLEERNKLEEQLAKLTPGTEEYNKLSMKRNVVKYLVNAVYGVMAYEGFRLFDPDIAGTITSLGREGIMATVKIAEEMGYKAVYGDTDSIMVQVPFKEAENLVKKLNEEINKYFVDKYNVKNLRIRLKFEKYYKRMFFKGVKKRYAGYVIWAGKDADYIDIKGFETVRRDTSEFISKLQRDLFELVLKHNTTREDVIKYLRQKLKEYKESSIDEIAIPKAITKPFEQYKNKPPHVRGALLANLFLGTNFQPGSRVKMLWVKHVEGVPKTSVICFDDPSRLKGRKLVVDWDKMFDIFRSEVESVLELYGISWDEVRGRTEKMDRWF